MAYGQSFCHNSRASNNCATSLYINVLVVLKFIKILLIYAVVLNMISYIFC